MREKSNVANREKLAGRPATARTTTKRSENPPGGDNPQFPLVSAAWLVRWLLAALIFAAACAYAALCFLFYQGQWQVVFYPSTTVASTPAKLGMQYDDIHFDYTETGLAQLDGWWIPAENPAVSTHSAQTLLFLHGAAGSLSDSLAPLRALHSLGVDLFAIDYRGFGLSEDTHPSEQGVYRDADAALIWLTEVRHVDPRSVVVYGQGLGATIAAEVARRHPAIEGLILDAPAPTGLTLINRDPRTKILPVRLLFRDRFELAPKLHELTVPKLFIEGSSTDYFAAAANPKVLVVPSASADHTSAPQVANFLQGLARSPARPSEK